MLTSPGRQGTDTCDPRLTLSRRDLLRVGGSGLLGVSLGGLFQLQARAAEAKASSAGGPGWGGSRPAIAAGRPGRRRAGPGSTPRGPSRSAG